MPLYTAAQLRKLWKPRMKALGFDCSSVFFRDIGSIRHMVRFLRRKTAPSIRIEVTINIRDQFRDPIGYQLCFGALLIQTGIHYWPPYKSICFWDERDVPQAIEA